MRAEITSANAAVAAAALVLLAGCDAFRLGSPDPPSPSAVAVAAAPERPTPPPVDMAGRWLLASTEGRKCSMTFGASPAANAPAAKPPAASGSATGAPGTIAPEGGCPGKFFTSRSFVFNQTGALVIRDHTGAPLGQLTMAGSGRFEGQGADGQALTLTR